MCVSACTVEYVCGTCPQRSLHCCMCVIVIVLGPIVNVCVCVCVGDIVQRAVKFHAAPLGRGSAN